MSFLPLLADRVLNRPLLLDPAKAETIFAVLEGRITLGADNVAPLAEIERASPEASRLVGSYRRENRPAGLSRKIGNTAVITVDGSLVNRGAWIGASSGLTSYEGLTAQIEDAAADREIAGILLDINSGGGEATGMFALASTIRAARASKPVIAFVNDVAASAAYGIASAADEVVVSPTSIVGSIGVVMLHLDRSKEVAAKGITPTLIHSGAHKVDGHPFGPLADDVRARLQADADTFYDRFLETVEAGRGARTTAQRARQTEARIFIGQASIDAGLADRMATFAEAVAMAGGGGAASGPSRAAPGAVRQEGGTPAPSSMAAMMRAAFEAR